MCLVMCVCVKMVVRFVFWCCGVLCCVVMRGVGAGVGMCGVWCVLCVVCVVCVRGVCCVCGVVCVRCGVARLGTRPVCRLKNVSV